MDQLIVVNKPEGYTSRDVVNKLSKILNTKKIGHTGTLDPIATGVLVCLTGKYTKLVDLLTALDKEYVAEIKLGIKTDTGDITGNVIDTSNKVILKNDILDVIKKFPKKYLQTVPKYSAVKIDGKKLYEYARENIDIELPKREVCIYNLELISFNEDIIKIKTKVSKGTYIRSLIEDICDMLGTVGCMKSLVRTYQGVFGIDEAYTLEDIKNNNYKSKNIHEFLDYPCINVEECNLKTVLNGGKISNIYNIKDKVIMIYNNKDLAIYEVDGETLKPYVMF